MVSVLSLRKVNQVVTKDENEKDNQVLNYQEVGDLLTCHRQVHDIDCEGVVHAVAYHIQYRLWLRCIVLDRRVALELVVLGGCRVKLQCQSSVFGAKSPLKNYVSAAFAELVHVQIRYGALNFVFAEFVEVSCKVLDCRWGQEVITQVGTTMWFKFDEVREMIYLLCVVCRQRRRRVKHSPICEDASFLLEVLQTAHILTFGFVESNSRDPLKSAHWAVQG